VQTFSGNTAEWLEADGLGGFASGTACGVRTRRYHGLLLAATTPPTGRMMLVNGMEMWVTTAAGRVALSTQFYHPGVQYPDGASRLVSFTTDPWPTWTWDLGGSLRIVQELFATKGEARVVTAWRVEGATGPVSLELRPLMSGRDYHALHRENGSFRFDVDQRVDALVWHPYDGVPAVVCLTNGSYHHEPVWFRQFLYTVERERGLDDTEDLASPGTITFDLTRVEALCVWQAGESSPATGSAEATSLAGAVREWRAAERRRRGRFDSALGRSADAYIVQRGNGRTIVAGYPWFTDWGRDTFIALRGLCLATGRLSDARDILLQWSDAVSEGMLPNRFPDAGGTPEYNAVDASLWYVIAVHDLLEQRPEQTRLLTRAQRVRLQDAAVAILEGYSRGTRYGIRMDSDGLLAAGETGQQLTWMDARVGNREITPRIGKPVEVQALWLNALHVGSAFDPRWSTHFARGSVSFSERFYNNDRRALFDVIDVDHRPGINDGTLRPNQILAVGGLPLPIITNGRARIIVDTVEQYLWTPMGLRTLARTEPGYVPHYLGDGATRDATYHQGTVWPWLMGAFVDAWLAVRNYSTEARRQAHERFVAPLRAHLDEAVLGHIPEIADAEPPFTPRGCPFQAWSLGELIRAEQLTTAGAVSICPEHV
jgi:predicted glycogen debranching enzyme